MYIFTVFVLALALCFCSVLPVKKTACSVGALDLPKDGRRMHKTAVARGGGLSVIFAFFCASLFAFSEYGEGISHLLGAILSGGALIAALGFCDDVSHLSAKVKLLAQLVIALIPLAFGIGTLGYSAPFENTGMLFTLLFTVSMMNALNFIDGLDGLAAGFSLIASFSLFICNIFSENRECALLCAALCGSALGFLPYNKHKAKIFMGDCGSLFFGYTLGLLGIATLNGKTESVSEYPIISALPLLLIFAYPLCDLTLAVARRLYHGKSIFSADAGHLHHRLIARGISHPKSVRLLLTASALPCLAGSALFVWIQHI